MASFSYGPGVTKAEQRKIKKRVAQSLAKNWKITSPPKNRKRKPVRLRYQDSSGKIYQGDFFWSDQEKTWVECVEGPDGIALYEEDGWKVLGWR